jgi:hypothetical protein
LYSISSQTKFFRATRKLVLIWTDWCYTFHKTTPIMQIHKLLNRAQCFYYIIIWPCIGQEVLRTCYVNILVVAFALSFTNVSNCRSQWPRSLRHEMSSLAKTLESWVQIPLKARKSVCVYSVFVLGSGFATGLSPVQGVLPTV